MLIVFTDKSIESDALINESIKEFCILKGITPFKYDIIRKNEEKPFIVPRKLHFNLSHSEAYKVCAVSTEDVGIDIQYHDNSIDISAISEKFLGYQISNKQNFFKYWVKAEARAKLEGKGLCTKLHIEENDSILLPFCKDYSLAVASSDKDIFYTEYYE